MCKMVSEAETQETNEWAEILQTGNVNSGARILAELKDHAGTARTLATPRKRLHIQRECLALNQHVKAKARWALIIPNLDCVMRALEPRRAASTNPAACERHNYAYRGQKSRAPKHTTPKYFLILLVYRNICVFWVASVVACKNVDE